MRRAYWLLIVVIMSMSSGLAFGQTISEPGSPVPPKAETYIQLELFGRAFDLMRREYLEEPETARQIETALDGMLRSLDPSGVYLNPEELRQTTRGNISPNDSLGSVGLEVMMTNGVAKVVSAIDDTPASRAGLEANDVITHLDEEPVENLNLLQIAEKLRGPVNSSVVLRVQSGPRSEEKEITLVREFLATRRVSHRIDGEDIGYLRVAQINAHTLGDLRAAIDDIRQRSPGDRLKGYILDLRNCPEGVFDMAVSVADAFLEKGEIVSVRKRQADQQKTFQAEPGDIAEGKPIVVLINNGSASAAEIVAGALQDHRRATIVGKKSFGQGSVQSLVSLGQNGAVLLATARYHTPSGRSIQGGGISPDIDVAQEPSPGTEDKQLGVAVGLLRDVQAKGTLPTESNQRAN